MKPLGAAEPSIAGYELLAQMSAGGMGQVLLARRRSGHGFEKLFAVKTIRADLARDERLRTMFLDEARLVARLSHPAIAQVVDFGESDDTLFMVMELVRGVPISQVTNHELPALPIRAALELIAELCRALHSAHEVRSSDGEPLGVVHRDVSPQNVLLTYDGAVKVIDFGIAKVRDRLTETTLDGQLKGKPSYMSPEQLNEDPIDRRSDIFAVSTVLHELLTGEDLFTRGNLGATIKAVITAEITPPSRNNPAVSPRLDALVTRGLARDPEQRWGSALELAQALDELAGDAPGLSLEAYALEHLDARREVHDREIRDYLDGRSPTTVDGRGEEEGTLAPVGRAQGELTRAPVSALGVSSANGSESTVDRDNGKTGDAITAAGTSRRWLAPIAIVLFLAAGVGGTAALQTFEVAPIPGGAPAAPDPEPTPAPPSLPNREPRSVQAGPAAVAQPAPKEANKRSAAKRSRPSRAPDRPRKREPKPQPAPEKTRSEKSAEPVGHGSLNAFADPFARVHIDGRYVGDTPLMKHPLAAGEHEVQLVSPDNDEVRLRRTVIIPVDGVATVKAE